MFESSIRALQSLHAPGYGRDGRGLVLNLVYKPNGAFLPPDPQQLQADYKQLLGDNFGIVCNQRFALVNTGQLGYAVFGPETCTPENFSCLALTLISQLLA